MPLRRLPTADLWGVSEISSVRLQTCGLASGLPSFKHNHEVLNPSGIKLFEFSAVVLSTMPVAWMYSTSKSLLIGNP